MIAAVIIGILSIVVPGFFLALALLKRTGMHMLEIFLIGIFFGVLFPPTMVWLESYLMNYIHIFSFSAGLYNADVIVLTIIGLVLSYWQGALTWDILPSFMRFGRSPSTYTRAKVVTSGSISADYRQRIAELRGKISRLNIDMKIVREHEQEELDLHKKHEEEIHILNQRGAGTEETESVKKHHENQEHRLFEDHEREEQMLLSHEDSTQQAHGQGQRQWTTIAAIILTLLAILDTAIAGFNVYTLVTFGVLITIIPIFGFFANKDRRNIVWVVLLLLMLVAFGSRIANIAFSPHFFEFDPYFDMISTQEILTYGYQLFTNHAAWPVLVNGTVQRIQPVVPYLEAYWYQLATPVSGTAINTSLLSIVSSIYPPLLAALLVFVVFMFVYHIYGDIPALIAGGLAVAMPTLITTYIAGEQLLEPWGITALFFFFAAYLLAVRNPNEKRYAILAGIAFVSNFLGAHYYTVTSGILAVYILLQSVINSIRNKNDISFYKMNAIVLIVIIIGYIAYAPYNAVYGGGVPSFLGIPTIVAFPLVALIFGFIVSLLTDTLDHKSIPRSLAGIATKTSSWFNANTSISIALSLIGLLLIVIGLFLLPVIILPGLLILSIFGVFSIIIGVVRGGWLGIERHKKTYARFAVIIVLGLLLIVSLLFTPLGNSVRKYLNLSIRFTTPSSPLFMTVQEYAPTGLSYNFGSSGFFGIIAADLGGFPVVLWLVLIVYAAIEAYNIVVKDSKSSIFSMTILAILAAAGMSEVKYLPHFGVVYIIAFAAVFAEIVAFIVKNKSAIEWRYVLYIFYAIIVVVESFSIIQVLSAAAAFSGVQENSAAYNTACNSMATGNYTNVVGATMFCNQVPAAWIAATTWMSQNIGPLGPRVLAWWDYGDWINWFGNTNAVIRGDNAVAELDYDTAARFVLGINSSFGPSALAQFMNQNTLQSQYVLFDYQLVPKWSALDFLACVDQNQTSQAFAESQGTKYGVNFVTGTSQCEISHDPVYISIPENPSISDYCSFSNSSIVAVHVLMTTGETVPQLLNQTYCVATSAPNNGTALKVYYANGTKANILVGLNSEFYNGAVQFTQNGPTYLQFMAVYLPNGPNDTIKNAPTYFYNSNYYRGFFLGDLSNQFTLAYPGPFNGINYINFTDPVVIFKLNNYTASLPTHTPKPSWVVNNYTLPG